MGGNYGRDLFKQLQETIVKVDKLSSEISDLKNENVKLMSKIEALEKENTTLKLENQKLKDIINKDSSNSSKPPSSDGFNKIQNSREKTGRKPGGQPGHKGAEHKLFDNPTKIIELKTEKCQCGGAVRYSDKYKAKQVADIEIVTSIIEYRQMVGICECCNKVVNTPSPTSDIITYGNNLKSFWAMLSIEGVISINRIKQIIYELTLGQFNLSEGTIAKWNKDLSIHVAPAICAIKEKLLASPVNHEDETGIRVNKSLHWFHVLGNKTHTLYCSHKKRGNEADKDMGILPSYSGILVHDHLKGLYSFTCRHAECNAHILRYLKSAVESKNRKWAQDMIKLLLYAKSGGKRSEVFKRYDDILKDGQEEFLKDESPDYNGEDMKLLRRMKQYKTEHLRFATDEDVPFDNNQAERDLRMIKAKAKISGCFRAADGGEVFATLKSYTSTLRKNGCNISDAICSAFDGSPVLF